MDFLGGAEGKEEEVKEVLTGSDVFLGVVNGKVGLFVLGGSEVLLVSWLRFEAEFIRLSESVFPLRFKPPLR